jgi:asparagine synthase (glutamine-hydrolysing)
VGEWAALCDGPIPVLPPAEAEEHYRLARKLGFRNMLGGDLAEFVMDRRYGFLPHLFVQRRFSALRTHIRHARDAGSSWPRMLRTLASVFAPRPLLVAKERRRTSWDDVAFPDWLDPRFIREPETRLFHHPRERWRKEQTAFFVGPGIGMEADEVCQALCGITVRRPWMDVDLCEFFLSLPAEVKFPGQRRKSLVRGMLRGRVPDEILDRKDKTFFNEVIMDKIDYQALRHWLVDPSHRIAGVNYQRLGEHLEREDLRLGDYKWALDLVKSQAFLAQW